MKILIVYAHPEPLSFNAALKDSAVEVLTGAKHEVVVSDLYALEFNPAGGPADFSEREEAQTFRYQREQIHATAKGLFVPELKAEMDKLVWADFVIFQFPLWWFSLPAILKGWVDRVFAMGFSYNIGQSFESGVFRGKRAMLSFTTGGPPAAYGAQTKYGDPSELLRHVQFGMLHYLGMDVLPPFIAYAAARVTPEQRTSYLAAYRERLLSLDSTAPIDFTRATR